MTKRALITLIVVVLVVGGAAALIASSIGEGSPSHTMPNGETMEGGSMGGPEGGGTGGMEGGSMEGMNMGEYGQDRDQGPP